MEPTYAPENFESSWYTKWENAGVFRPEINPDGEPFCMVIPPPNVTGQLHMGHALNHVMIDAIIRRKRMQGFAALWVPGTDHAGIATQNVVEKALAEEGMTRHELGREAFLEQVWAWKEKYGNRITLQMRTLGNSCDWGRERFTMDDGMSQAVREVFVSLWEQELMYRGFRMGNWCPRCGTAISDIEVEHEDEVGELAHLKYPLEDGSGHLIVATTRAETMLGDTAVAVHPDDERYTGLVGKFIILPLVGRRIPIVADDFVDPAFGTGAVKVTPAHDPNDYEIGLRHDLPVIQVLDLEAKINDNGGDFVGMDRFEARKAVKVALDELGLLEGVDEHNHSVGHCSRSGTVVEPMLSDQWYVKVKPLTDPAIDVVREGLAEFNPKRWENSYFHWMENLRDWCVSRQLWWGHRIPAWFCDACGDGTEAKVFVSREDLHACPDCGGSVRQDEDVLDTWFSSALFPFSVFGWPDKTPDLEKFYPNSAMLTGFDIIYFWVARMLQMGLHFMDEVPFPSIVIHGLVRDSEGRKMSKSLGNGIDPMEVIAEHGADPLRLALLQSAAPGHDVPFDMDRVEAARRFGNKLWNAARLVLQHVEPGSVPAEGGYPENPAPADAWIMSRFAEVQVSFDDLCDKYRFSDAYAALYSFVWSELFDWYLELSKPALYNESTRAATAQTLGAVFRDALKLFAPAMPFVTEELWSELVGEEFIATSSWPAMPAVEAPASMGTLQEVIGGVRSFRSQHGISPREHINLQFTDAKSEVADWWEPLVDALANVTLVAVDAEPGAGHTRIVANGVHGFIALEGLIDVGAERARIEKAIAGFQVDAKKANGKLSNEKFVRSAPAEIVEKVRGQLEKAQSQIDALQSQLTELG